MPACALAVGGRAPLRACHARRVPGRGSVGPPPPLPSLAQTSALRPTLTFPLPVPVRSQHSFILEKSGEKHYMKGGKPGFFPPTDNFPHPVPLNLYDPFNGAKGMSEEVKAKRRNIEINNGRLAMIGIMGFVAEATVPGSVPFGPHLAPYAGNVMIPFA